MRLSPSTDSPPAVAIPAVAADPAAVPAAPAAPGRLFYLDVIRGVAVLLVLGHHTPATVRIHPIPDAISDAVHDMGYLGVDLFFVLSGFLIGGLLFRELDRTGTIRVGRFLARRAFKIWPAYLVCLVVSCLALAAWDQRLADDPNRYRTVAVMMWPAFLHVQNYFPSTGYFIHFWSLGVEEHFYLLLPVVLGAGVRLAGPGRAFRVVAGLAAGVAVGCLLLRAIAWVRYPEYEGYVHHLPTHVRIDSLLAGVFLAAATRYAPAGVRRLRPWRWVLAAAGAAFFLLPALVPGVHPTLFPILYPFDCTLAWLAAMAIVLLAHFADEAAGRPGGAAGGRRVVRWVFAPVALVGFLSYSIYLWHFYFAAPFSKRALEWLGHTAHGTGASTVVHLGLYLAVAVGLGLASYLLVERPFLALRERACPKRKAPPPAPVGPPAPAAVGP